MGPSRSYSNASMPRAAACPPGMSTSNIGVVAVVLVAGVRRLGWAAVVAIGIAGCGPDANDPLSRLTVYDEPSGIYRLRYLEPPWVLEQAEGTSAILRVLSNTERYLGEDLLDSDVIVPQKYWLEVTVEAGNTLGRATADQGAIAGRMETLVEPVREVETSSGDMGHEVLTHATMPFSRNRRY